MPQSKVYFLKATDDRAVFSIPTEEFNNVVDQGYELIAVTTPTSRYVSDVEDWLTIGYTEYDGEDEIMVLHRSFMVKA